MVIISASLNAQLLTLLVPLQVLNCNTYDVATHAAIELKADKLFCVTGDDVAELGLPQWLPLSDAEQLIMRTISEVPYMPCP